MSNHLFTYEDISDAHLDLLQAANHRYHMFLGHGGDLDEQARQDRAMYPHLLTFSPAGNGCISDEKSIAFLMAVTGLSREICTVYSKA